MNYALRPIHVFIVKMDTLFLKMNVLMHALKIIMFIGDHA